MQTEFIVAPWLQPRPQILSPEIQGSAICHCTAQGCRNPFKPQPLYAVWEKQFLKWSAEDESRAVQPKEKLLPGGLLALTSPLSRRQRRMKWARPWVSSVLVVFGSTPPPYITNAINSQVCRCSRCSELTLKASSPQNSPKISNHCLISWKQLVILHWKKLSDAALRHQTSCYTLSPVIGGHSEVITLNGYVTETELGQIDGITPWAALYWQQITLLRSNKKNVNYRIKDAGYELLFSAFESSKMWHLDGTGPREQTAPIILETQHYILQKNHCPPSLQ